MWSRVGTKFIPFVSRLGRRTTERRSTTFTLSFQDRARSISPGRKGNSFRHSYSGKIRWNKAQSLTGRRFRKVRVTSIHRSQFGDNEKKAEDTVSWGECILGGDNSGGNEVSFTDFSVTSGPLPRFRPQSSKCHDRNSYKGVGPGNKTNRGDSGRQESRPSQVGMLRSALTIPEPHANLSSTPNCCAALVCGSPPNLTGDKSVTDQSCY